MAERSCPHGTVLGYECRACINISEMKTCPGCGATDCDPETGEEWAYLHDLGCPVDYEPPIPRLPDGTAVMYGHETEVWHNGAKWAQKQIADDLRKKAGQLVTQGHDMPALGMYAAAYIVEEGMW